MKYFRLAFGLHGIKATVEEAKAAAATQTENVIIDAGPLGRILGKMWSKMFEVFPKRQEESRCGSQFSYFG
jgi:hypothetical protein